MFEETTKHLLFIVAPGTPVTVTEKLGPRQRVDSPIKLESMDIKSDANQLSIRYIPEPHTRRYFVKDPEGGPGSRVLSCQMSANLGLNAFKGTSCIFTIGVQGRFDAESQQLSITASKFTLYSVQAGPEQDFPNLDLEAARAAYQSLIDDMRLTEVSISIPIWTMPDISGLTRPNDPAPVETLIHSNATFDEFRAWLDATYPGMVEPQVTARGDDSWLTDAAPGGARYRITNDWSTQPMTYQIVQVSDPQG